MSGLVGIGNDHVSERRVSDTGRRGLGRSDRRGERRDVGDAGEMRHFAKIFGVVFIRCRRAFVTARKTSSVLALEDPLREVREDAHGFFLPALHQVVQRHVVSGARERGDAVDGHQKGILAKRRRGFPGEAVHRLHQLRGALRAQEALQARGGRQGSRAARAARDAAEPAGGVGAVRRLGPEPRGGRA